MKLSKKLFLKGDDALLENFKNKPEILSAINDLQLSRQTVTRRIEFMGKNVFQLLIQGRNECVYFSLQFDESTDQQMPLNYVYLY